jgi:activator of HSP90 ATPase
MDNRSRGDSKALQPVTARRSVIAGLVMAIGGLAARSSRAACPQQQTAAGQSTGAEGLLTYLHQEVDFHAAPHRIYEALLDAKQFAAFTGMPAQMNREPGGAFSTFGGRIEGRNVELVPDKRVVQAWRPASWDAGVYSIVRFELVARESQTRLVLDHTGFPEGSFRHLNSGWYERYWEPLKKFLA